MRRLIALFVIASTFCASVDAADHLFEFREGRYRQSVWIPDQDAPLRGILLDNVQWRYNYDPTVLREAARRWGFAYVTTTSKVGKGLKPIAQGLDQALQKVATASSQPELPALPIMLLMTQDQPTGGLGKLFFNHFHGRILGVVAHAPSGMPGLPSKKQVIWPHPVLAIAGSDSTRFNEVPDLRRTFMPARAAGAQWAVAVQPFSDQEFFPWFDVIIPWAEGVISQRLGADGGIKNASDDSAWLGSRYDRPQDLHIALLRDSSAETRAMGNWFPNEASAIAWQARILAEHNHGKGILVRSGTQQIPETRLMQLPLLRVPLNASIQLSLPRTRATFFINGLAHSSGTEVAWQPDQPGLYVVTGQADPVPREPLAARPWFGSAYVLVGDEPELIRRQFYEESVDVVEFSRLSWSQEERDQARELLSGLDRLRQELRAPMHAQSYLQLLLEGAGDGDDAYLTLEMNGAEKKQKTHLFQASAFVPAWNQDTFDAGYGFYFRGGAGALWHQRHVFPVIPEHFQLSENSDLKLSGTWSVQRNRFRAQRLEPANHHTLPGMPGAYSNYDYLEPEVHKNPRPLPLQVEARPQADRYWLELRLNGLADGATAEIRAAWPPQPSDPQYIMVLNYNGASHRVDTSELVINHEGVSGFLRLQLNPDRWLPADRLRREVIIPLQLNWQQAAAIDLNVGVEDGATVNGQAVSGHITGTISPLWSGRYQVGGRTGRVFGGTTAIIDRQAAADSQSTNSLVAQFMDRWQGLS